MAQRIAGYTVAPSNDPGSNSGAVWNGALTPDMIKHEPHNNSFDSRELPWLMTQENGTGRGKSQFTLAMTAMTGRGTTTDPHPPTGESAAHLADRFFSQENTDAIQYRLQSAVKQITNGKIIIERQSDRDVYIRMRAVFRDYALHTDMDLDRQIANMNNRLVAQVVPVIINNIKQNFGYQKDIVTRPVPLAPPLNVSSKGRRSLPSTTIGWQNSNWQGSGGASPMLPL